MASWSQQMGFPFGAPSGADTLRIQQPLPQRTGFLQIDVGGADAMADPCACGCEASSFAGPAPPGMAGIDAFFFTYILVE
jgi:hypothetical protein